MGRSERRFVLSEEAIQRWKEEAEIKQAFDVLRRQLIEKALRKLKKNELVDLLMDLDTFDPSVRWSIESSLSVQKPIDLIAFDLRYAIQIATKVDSEQIGYDFHYSWQAYEEVGRGFEQLLKVGAVELAKTIAVEFADKASYQVECSDQGLMMYEILLCLKPVLLAAIEGGIELAKAWALDMLCADRVGLIYENELRQLAQLASPSGEAPI